MTKGLWRVLLIKWAGIFTEMPPHCLPKHRRITQRAWCQFSVLISTNYLKITMYDIIWMVLKPIAWEGTKFERPSMFFLAILLPQPLSQAAFFPVKDNKIPPLPFPHLSEGMVWATLLPKILRDPPMKLWCLNWIVTNCWEPRVRMVTGIWD